MSYLSPLEKTYRKHADKQRAAAMAKYMKDKFEYFGIMSPVRKELDRDFLRQYGKPEADELSAIIKEAYRKPQREFQYFINELAKKYVKHLPEDFIETARVMLVTKSWWDTVDAVAADIVGGLVKQHPALLKTMDAWIDDENMWLQRTALLHQLRYKKQTDEKRLFAYCMKHAAQKEFFIRKAIGWALREYSKTNPAAVKKFVKNAPLSNFSKKEAMKVIERANRANA